MLDPTRFLAVIMVAGAGALAGCNGSHGSDVHRDGERVSVDCPKPGPGGLMFWDDVASMRVGQQRALVPGLVSMPGHFEPLESACLRDLKLSVPEAGEIVKTEYGDYDVRILDTAPLGERISLSATYRGQTIRAQFAVFDPVKTPLVGYWTQEEGSCPDEAVIRELIFSADGSFSVTWEPFEVYKDYWGTYTFDADASELTLNVRSGNFQAPGISSGTVALEDNTLTLETASFGRRFEQGAECAAPFVR